MAELSEHYRWSMLFAGWCAQFVLEDALPAFQAWVERHPELVAL